MRKHLTLDQALDCIRRLRVHGVRDAVVELSTTDDGLSRYVTGEPEYHLRTGRRRAGPQVLTITLTADVIEFAEELSAATRAAVAVGWTTRCTRSRLPRWRACWRTRAPGASAWCPGSGTRAAGWGSVASMIPTGQHDLATPLGAFYPRCARCGQESPAGECPVPRRAYAAAVYVVRGARVLLIKHKLLGMWLPVGGELEPNELPEQAAARELREETGYEVERWLTPRDLHRVDGTPEGMLGYETSPLAQPKGVHLIFSFACEVRGDGAPVSDGSWTEHAWCSYQHVAHLVSLAQTLPKVRRRVQQALLAG